MSKFLKVALVLTLVFGVVGVAGCGGSGSESSDAGESGNEKFVFANSGAFKPFSFDDDSEIVGFDVEVGYEIAKRIDREPEMVSRVPWDSLIQSLKSGKYDALIASHAITPEREEQVDFTRPYYRSGACMFVAEDNTDVLSADDLYGKTIGVVKGSTYLEFANTLTDPGKVTTYDSDIIALQDLGTSRLDAVITDKLVGLHARQESGVPIKMIGEALYTDEMGIAVKEGDTELLEAINQALEDMIADGTYDEISNRWFGESILGE